MAETDWGKKLVSAMKLAIKAVKKADQAVVASSEARQLLEELVKSLKKPKDT